MARTAIAYIDGFNFYHGVVKTAPALKWLDYRAMSVGIEVVVVNPHQRTNSTPSLVGSGTRKLKLGDLRRSQFTGRGRAGRRRDPRAAPTNLVARP